MDIDKLEAYFESLEIYVHDTVNRLWVDISRYGPGLPSFPEVHLPLGDFQVPPPPPPPPPRPTSWLDSSCTWVSKHPWKTVGLVIGVAGTGLLLAGYTKAYTRRPRSQAARTQRNERRQVVGMCWLDSHGPAGLLIQMQSYWAAIPPLLFPSFKTWRGKDISSSLVYQIQRHALPWRANVRVMSEHSCLILQRYAACCTSTSLLKSYAHVVSHL